MDIMEITVKMLQHVLLAQVDNYVKMEVHLLGYPEIVSVTVWMDIQEVFVKLLPVVLASDLYRDSNA